MPVQLLITPHGGLRITALDAASGEAPATLSAAAERRLTTAFEAGPAEGMLHLATALLEADLPQAFDYVRGIARRYLTTFAQAATQTEGELKPLAPPPDETMLALAEDAPLIVGGEYLNRDLLVQWWKALDDHVRTSVSADGLSVSQWLEQQHPAWRAVGRVTFHLAENKRNETHPFAFLATYADRLSDRGQVQHLPLSRAVRESAAARAREQLLALLTPIQRAAERVEWVEQLIEDGGIYQPLAWTPRQAYAFLQSVEALRDAGLVVRTPDWWNARQPPRPRVSVTVGDARQSAIGVGALLDFSVGVTLDGERLSEAELHELLLAANAAGGAGDLVRLRGRWVELDRDKLSQALDHWRRIEREARDGVSFFQAMRWLSGVETGAEEQTASPEQAATWVGVEPGPWLKQTLAKLREPSQLPSEDAAGLRASLRPYQQVGVGWLKFMTSLKLGACLADDMGLGKTIQVLALLLQLKAASESPGPGADASPPSLLVVPASLMANWRAEIDRFAPSLLAVTLHPAETTVDLKSDDAVRRGVAGCDLVITTYGMVTRTSALRERPWRLVILDEAQAIRNSGTRQAHAVKRLRADARIALTGTPVENRLSDLWSLFDFLNPGLLGSAAEFKRFIKRLSDDGHAHYAPLRRLVQPYILRRLKTDRRVIADLPEKTEVRAFCGLTKAQAALYQQSVHELARQLHEADGIQRRGVVLAFLMRFKQICNHPTQWHGAGDYDAQHSGKFQRLAALCEELAQRQERPLVFTQFREITAPLADLLAGVFGRPGLVMHGGTPVRQRQDMVRRFQRDDGPPFFVLSLKAGGAGLNLTAASHVIHFDRWWNPAVENQATDRAFRIGQQRNVLVHKFVCRGTVEEKIDAMIADKVALADAVLETDGGKMLTEMRDEELLRFVALDVNKAGEL